MFTFPQIYTVDKVKVLSLFSSMSFWSSRGTYITISQTEVFRNIPSLNESMKFDYYLGIDEEVLITRPMPSLTRVRRPISFFL